MDLTLGELCFRLVLLATSAISAWRVLALDSSVHFKILVLLFSPPLRFLRKSTSLPSLPSLLLFFSVQYYFHHSLLMLPLPTKKIMTFPPPLPMLMLFSLKASSFHHLSWLSSNYTASKKTSPLTFQLLLYSQCFNNLL